MARMEDIKVRIIPMPPPGGYRETLAASALAAGFTQGARERGSLRLLLAIAEQERDDAEQERDDALADAAAYCANRNSLQGELRHARLRANEDQTLICAARNLGREQEAELEALRADVRRGRGLIRRALTAANQGLAPRDRSALIRDLYDYLDAGRA